MVALSLLVQLGASALIANAQYSLVGCIAQGTIGSRLALLDFQTTSNLFMDVNFCFSVCSRPDINTNFAALYNGNSCMCGNSTTNNGASGSLISSTNCQTPCTGNPTQKCGDNHSAVLYSKSNITIDGWTPAGCYTDSNIFRALPAEAAVSNSNSVKFCTTACAKQGFTIAGMEFSNECWCGNDLKSSDGIAGRHANEIDCSSPCPGNSREMCGAAGRMNVWITGV